jgi:hypothetical protein
VQIPYHILTIQMESWGFIKSSALYQSVQMELSLCLSFYLMHNLGGCTMSTTMRFPAKDVEALAPQSCHRILQKYPQYYLRTCSAHHQVTGFVHPLNGGLGGYYRGIISWVLWVAGYSPNISHLGRLGAQVWPISSMHRLQ